MNKTKFEILVSTLTLIKHGILDADLRMEALGVEALAEICNGCGDAKRSWVPDTMYGLDISPACMIHDFGYSIGETAADRRFEDNRFKSNLKVLISKGSKLLWLPRTGRVATYYNIVRLCGEEPFWSGKLTNVITLTSHKVTEIIKEQNSEDN